MSQASKKALGPALPCNACKLPVIETRSVDGAVVVLDASTKRLHLCAKRKEMPAAKAKPAAAARAERTARPDRPVRERVQGPRRPDRPERPGRPTRSERPQRPERPVRQERAGGARKPIPPRRKPKPATRRTAQQVQEILNGPIVRWRTAEDSPTSFCAECSAPVLVGFSHVRWDVMILDAVGHRPHDCATSRAAAVALRREREARPIDIPELPAVAELAHRVVRPAPPTEVGAAKVVEAKPTRPSSAPLARGATANSCDTCGKPRTLRGGEWVCLHCGA